MSGNKIGATKAKTGFGKKGYKPGSMISKMNASKMTAGSASGAGRMQKAAIKTKARGKASKAAYKILN